MWARLRHLENTITDLCERIESLPAVYNAQLFDLGLPAYKTCFSAAGYHRNLF